MKKFGLLLLLSVIFGGALILLVTCDDNPIKTEPEVSDYDIYFRDFNYGKFYVFNTKAMALVDTFELPYPGAEPQVSADGRYLFIPHEKVAVVDVKTKELVTELDASGDRVEISPDNRFIAVLGDSLAIFDAVSFTKVFTDTINPLYGHFTHNSGRFYCTIYPPLLGYQLYRLDLSTEPPLAEIIGYPGHFPGFAVVSRDESHIYLIAGNPIMYFEIYNRLTDSLEFSHRLQTWIAYITISPDGKYVIYDEGERFVTTEDPLSPRTISVYDVAAQRMKTVIPTFGVVADYMEGIPAGNLIVTPDCRWLVAGGGGLVLVDLQKMQTMKIITLPYTAIGHVSCRQIKK
ncbi:MAG: hypothetical protein NT002_09320 [candidate division Zixibacteria bacterium]|nr:hypothetical protein [candidate division Zixibacteria bacterium]